LNARRTARCHLGQANLAQVATACSFTVQATGAGGKKPALNRWASSARRRRWRKLPSIRLSRCEIQAKCGVTPAEFEEAFAVGLIVGGSIVIPHLRRAYARMDEVLAAGNV
jgi:hypothetical protein